MNDDILEQAKSNYNLLELFPNAKRINSATYRVNPCPKCGGNNHFTLYAPNGKNNYWTYSSFNGCCNGGSIIDYFIEIEGLSKEGAIQKVLENNKGARAVIKREHKSIKQEEEKQYNFNDLAEKLHSQCLCSNGIDYFKSRGLEKTIGIYKLGYEEEGYNKAFKGFNELLISNTVSRAYKYFIPIIDSKGEITRILARHDNSITEDSKVRNMRGVTQVLFNQRYLVAPPVDKFLFICEGWADALSLEEVGRKAIALNSVAMVNKFVEMVRDNINKLKDKIFIIALDTDTAGTKATEQLTKALEGLKLTVKVLELGNEYKDVNEFLVGNKKGLIKAVEKVESEIIESAYKFTDGANLFTSLLEEVETNYSNGGLKLISTGFPELDKKIGGGLYNGLYIIGAGSSIGKTTMVQQIADNIASNGKKVLFFSLEMGRKEMLSKSIVRELYKSDEIEIGSRQLLNGAIKEDAINLLAKKSDILSKTLENIYYLEGNFGTNIEEIVNTTKEFKNIYGVAPVVIVDYLQVIAPMGNNISDKQNVDRSISELKRLSRDLETPVIAISSVNRQNYLSYIDFSSFKESGAIEYGADVVLGLQLSAIHSILEEYKEGDKNTSEKRIAYNNAKAENPRKIEVVILKNRYGVSTGAHEYLYNPTVNYFEEVDEVFNEKNEVKEASQVIFEKGEFDPYE